MPRLVRRRPLVERIKSYLNPLDFLLWLSEEVETRDWDHKSFAVPVGLTFNLVFLLARSVAGAANDTVVDDIFTDYDNSTGWFNWFCSFLVTLLSIISVINAFYTFSRKRHYRLFENAIDSQPSTPSAQRVRVDSSPAASPLRYLTKIIKSESAESRAHPDETRDVWELAVWDPLPICLRLFCLFSPGHVLVYWVFIPVASSDARPSTTVVTTLFLQVLLSAQLLLIQSNYSQQIKDTSVIHKEVMNEYDIKFVHPRTNPVVRDVGTQFDAPSDEAQDFGNGIVEIYTPTTILKRGFRTNPNPRYSKHIDPDNTGMVPSRTVLTPNTMFHTPVAYSQRETTPFRTVDKLKIRQPQFRTSTPSALSKGVSASTGMDRGQSDGGSLGIYNHANSPLKKASSLFDMKKDPPRNSYEMTALEQGRARERSLSPNKRRRETEQGLLRDTFMRQRSPTKLENRSGDGIMSPYGRDRDGKY